MGQSKFNQILKKNSFWLSIVLHLLILLSFFHFFHDSPPVPERPNLFMSAYLYKDTPPPAQALQADVSERPIPTSSPQRAPEPVNRTDSRSVPNARPVREPLLVKKPSNDDEAVHLVGDHKTLPQPLIRLLAKALTASLIYPKSAVDFGLRGTAYVRFLVEPNGEISHVELVKSSSATVLDQAAVQAVIAISPLKQVGAYLSQPKYIVFGFIFG